MHLIPSHAKLSSKVWRNLFRQFTLSSRAASNLRPPSLCLLSPNGVDCIPSAEGVQQGDPLGPFLFSLALHPCLKAAAKKCKHGFVVSYLDDAMVAGPKTDVLEAYD